MADLILGVHYLRFDISYHMELYMRLFCFCLMSLIFACLNVGHALDNSYGTFQGTLVDETGKQYMQYQATVPNGGKSARGRRLGLIVGLHGINGNERQLTGSLTLLACIGLHKLMESIK